MAGGNSHQRAIEKAAKARMAEEVTEAVVQKLQEAAAMPRTPSPSINRKGFWAKLFDFIEQPLTLGALFLLGGILGTILFTPAFVICAICVLLGLHRSGVVADRSKRVQITVFVVLAVAISIGGYLLYGMLDSALQKLQTESAKKVASFVESQKAKPVTDNAPLPTRVKSRNPTPSPAQMEVIKELNSFIVEDDEMTLRNRFGFPEMMNTNIRAIINNLERYKRTGQLHHYVLPPGDTLIDSRFASGHLRKQGGAWIADYDDLTIFFILLPKGHSEAVAHLRRLENNPALPKEILPSLKEFDGAVAQNNTFLIEVLHQAMTEDHDYFLEYDNPNSVFFHKLDSMYLDKFISLRSKANGVRDAIRRFMKAS